MLQVLLTQLCEIPGAMVRHEFLQHAQSVAAIRSWNLLPQNQSRQVEQMEHAGAVSKGRPHFCRPVGSGIGFRLIAEFALTKLRHQLQKKPKYFQIISCTFTEQPKSTRMNAEMEVRC